MACSRAAMEFSGRFCDFQAPRWAMTRVSEFPPQAKAKKVRGSRSQMARFEGLDMFNIFFMRMPFVLKTVPGLKLYHIQGKRLGPYHIFGGNFAKTIGDPDFQIGIRGRSGHFEHMGRLRGHKARG